MVHCVAFGCQNGDYNKKKPGITFHKNILQILESRKYTNYTSSLDGENAVCVCALTPSDTGSETRCGTETSCKDALAQWAVKNNDDPTKAKEILLQFRWPPIDKMDTALSSLVECEFLSLSTNNIEKITGLQGMKNLRVLSLARNNVKSLQGLAPVANTLQELWISYNEIEKLKGIEVLTNLKVLYLKYNMIKEWGEVNKLNQATALEELSMMGNPLNETMEEEEWIKAAFKRLPNIKKLEGEIMLGDEED